MFVQFNLLGYRRPVSAASSPSATFPALLLTSSTVKAPPICGWVPLPPSGSSPLSPTSTAGAGIQYCGLGRGLGGTSCSVVLGKGGITAAISSYALPN